MDGRRSRADLVPNANNPRLLLRLVGFVATGVRRAAPLAELLEVELRTVHYYTQAAEWLGLMESGGELRLTARGLALAYAGPAGQRQLYAEAAWSNPLAAAIMGNHTELPPPDQIADIIRSRDRTLSPATARRRASAVRSLLAPALAHKPDAKAARGDQLGLPFPTQAAPTTPEPVDLAAGTEESPDVYRRLLIGLLDNGELSTGQVRAVLDGMGARDAPLGRYIDMALRRGDAIRIDDSLVATVAAAGRSEVAEDGVLVALTDPLYRKYLDGLDAAGDALARATAGRASAEDVDLRNKVARLAARFATWDQRIFGRRLQPGEVEDVSSSLLLGRRLAGMPIAGDPGAPHHASDRPYLDLIDQPGVALCFPRSVLGLRGGVKAVNERLGKQRASPAGVRPPGPLDPRLRVHGGLVPPTRVQPRAVPDNISLRLRSLSNVPAISLLAALLLSGRRGAGRPIVRVGLAQDTPVVHLPSGPPQPLLSLLARFAASLGHVVIRPPCDGLTDAELAEVAVDLGVAARASGRLLLDEPLFARLQEDPECRLVYEALLPLEDHLMAWLESE